MGIVELLIRPLATHIACSNQGDSDDKSNLAEHEFYDEMESIWVSSIVLGFDLCARIFRQDNPIHRIELCRSIILRSGLTDHAMLVVKSKRCRRHIELITSATRVLELSLSQNVKICDDDNVEKEKKESIVVEEEEVKISKQVQVFPPGMDVEEQSRRVSSVGPRTPPGIRIRNSLHTSTIATSISKAAQNMSNEDKVADSEHLNVLTKSLKDAAHALKEHGTSTKSKKNAIHHMSLASSLSHAAYVLSTNGEDHHKSIAKTLIETASKLNSAAKMHVTKKILPVGISKVDDEKLLEEIRSREEKGM